MSADTANAAEAPHEGPSDELRFRRRRSYAAVVAGHGPAFADAYKRLESYSELDNASFALVRALPSDGAGIVAALEGAGHDNGLDLAQRMLDADIIVPDADRAEGDASWPDDGSFALASRYAMPPSHAAAWQGTSAEATQALRGVGSLSMRLIVEGRLRANPVYCVLSSHHRTLYIFRDESSQLPRRSLPLDQVVHCGVQEHGDSKRPCVVLRSRPANRLTRLRMPSWDAAQRWLEALTARRGSLRERRRMQHEQNGRHGGEDAGEAGDGGDEDGGAAGRVSKSSSVTSNQCRRRSLSETDAAQAGDIAAAVAAAAARAAGAQDGAAAGGGSSAGQSAGTAPARSSGSLRPPGAAGGPAVLELEDVLDTPQYCVVLREYTAASLCAENVHFLEAVRAYMQLFHDGPVGSSLLAPPGARSGRSTPVSESSAMSASAGPPHLTSFPLDPLELRRRVSLVGGVLTATADEPEPVPVLELPTTAAGGCEDGVPGTGGSDGEGEAFAPAPATSARASVIREAAERMFARYLADGAPECVNVDSDTRAEVSRRVAAGEFTRDLFQRAGRVIFDMVQRDVYRRFVTSAEYRSMQENPAVHEERALRTHHRKNISFAPVALREDPEPLQTLARQFAAEPGNLQSRRVHFRRHVCFKGAGLVDWLVANGAARHRPAAVALGQRMMDCGLIAHVSREQDFQDATALLYTVEDEALAAVSAPPATPRGGGGADAPPSPTSDDSGAVTATQVATDPSYRCVCATPALLKGVRYNNVYAMLAAGRDKGGRLYVFRSEMGTRPLFSLKLRGAAVTVSRPAEGGATAARGAAYLQIAPRKSGGRVYTFRFDGLEGNDKLNMWTLALSCVGAEVERCAVQTEPAAGF